ncbi:hypothetical protein PMEGAPR236_04680 [Priestia megaterium]
MGKKLLYAATEKRTMTAIIVFKTCLIILKPPLIKIFYHFNILIVLEGGSNLIHSTKCDKSIIFMDNI